MAITARPPVPLGDENDHYWLVQRMARATGTDLVAAHDSGDLSQTQWAEIVHRCRGCQWAGPCSAWLDTPDDDDSPRQTPRTCVNQYRFAVLRRHNERRADER